jgi:ATP-dependent DNA helicase PIF1
MLELKEKEESLESQLATKQFAAIFGRAGTGKTFAMREIAENNSRICLSASTGIAAVNLDATTVHSKLKFFNTQSLEEAYIRKSLHANLSKLTDRYDTLVIDEASMINAKTLDIIVQAMSEINENLNLYLIGDLLQLPPVTGKGEEKAEYICNAAIWPLFDENTITLTKIWRQENPLFISAINSMRESKGIKALELLKQSGVAFIPKLIESFDGTTIIAVNKEVDSFNNKELMKLKSPLIRISPTRRGRQKKEWDNYIPYEMRFKKDCYVMILTNDIREWKYANGDCGTIVDYDSKSDRFSVKLKRNGKIVQIGRITRRFLTDKTPNQVEFNSMFTPTIDHITGEWCIGEIKYHPLRIAYASTCHKVQGLSLDKVQIDIRHNFFSYPSMLYTGISRARTPENLVIVGSEKDFITKCKISDEVKRWI